MSKHEILLHNDHVIDILRSYTFMSQTDASETKGDFKVIDTYQRVSFERPSMFESSIEIFGQDQSSSFVRSSAIESKIETEMIFTGLTNR